MHRDHLALALAVLCGAGAVTVGAAGCGRGTAKETPGYSGSVPSPAAQGWLRPIRGQTLTVGAGAGLAAGAWTVEQFGVVPNPVTGKSPVVLVKNAAGATDYIPVDGDADIADLVQRVTGSSPGQTTGAPGARYLARVGAAVAKASGDGAK